MFRRLWSRPRPRPSSLGSAKLSVEDSLRKRRLLKGLFLALLRKALRLRTGLVILTVIFLVGMVLPARLGVHPAWGVLALLVLALAGDLLSGVFHRKA